MDQIIDWMPRLVDGLRYTVILTVLSFALSLVVALIIAAMRLNPALKVLYVPATIYLEVFRCTPMILQLFFAYFALPSLGINLSPMMAGVLTLGLCVGAYLSEVFRAAILAVDRGQWEASSALAMSWPMMMRYTILPQAARIALPSTGNYAIALFKDSALASTVSVVELLFSAQLIASESFEYIKVYAVIGVFYFAICYPTSLAIRRLERKLDITLRRSSQPALNVAPI
jgi:His/Glu/Gln/Arg/opine family amino acid ABC transporter permease subunit